MAAAARMSGTRFPWSSRLKCGVAALSATRRTSVVLLDFVPELLEALALDWAQAVPAAHSTTAAARPAVFSVPDTPTPATTRPRLPGLLRVPASVPESVRPPSDVTWNENA